MSENEAKPILPMLSAKLMAEMAMCNTYDFEWTIHSQYPQCEIKAGKITMIVSHRPVYCDRGRYNIFIEKTPDSLFGIDAEDCFPRYFFNLQRAIDELKDWYDFNELRIKKDK